MVGCLDASIEVSSIGLKSYTHLEKAGDIMHRANAHVRAGLVSVVLTVSAICILASPTLGQVRRRDKAGKAPPASVEDRIDAQQAKAWSAFYAGKHPQAARQAGALLKAPKESARVQAAHCQARCYWATGRKSRSTSANSEALFI